MKKTEFFYPSSDGITQIHAIKWEPDEKPKCIVQIAHGMAEYVDRYDEFARFLNGHGIMVVGNDHLGHGKSVTGPEKLGYFADEDGNLKVVADLHKLRELTQAEYPDASYIFMGHSMGSFLTRQYITMHAEGLSGAIIMGTGNNPPAAVSAGKMLCKSSAAVRGWNYKSSFIDGIATGSYNNGLGKKGGKEWLSVNKENVEKYVADPLCGFTFSLNAFYNMFEGLEWIANSDNLEKMPKDLPIYFVSGEEDPVGGCGKGVRECFESFKKLGMKNVSLKLYPGDRHEILQENDKNQVETDILGWISNVLGE